MKTFDNEDAIIDFFKSTSIDELVLIGDINTCKNIANSILDDDLWADWKSSFGKNDSPPDFYNDKNEIMMDVMRVDDHETKQKNKIINLTHQKEGKAIKKILNELGANINEDTMIIPNVCTDLPTFEDHDYSKYLSCFERVINKHKDSIPLYKKNHPNYKTIFLIFDESSGYIESALKNINFEPQINQSVLGEIHLYCLDRKFIKIIKDSETDYIIWFAPYKQYILPDKKCMPFPKGVIIDVNSINIDDKEFVDYNSTLMVSSEV